MTDIQLNWSEPKRITTARGDRLVSEAPATQTFWAAWRADKEALRAAGISPRKVGDSWVVSRYQPLPAEEVAKDVEAIEASRATDADVELPVPAGLAYLPYQRAGIAYGASRAATLIADEMGLGKTIQAIGIANVTKARRILIICPASLKLNWQRELTKWLTEPRSIEIARTGKPFPASDVVIINYDIVKKFHGELRAEPWDLLVADECHYLKNPKAQRTIEIVGGKTVDAIPAKRRVLLTGTPIVNRPVELWPLISYLDPTSWPNFFKFAKTYCDARHNGYGWDFSGSSNLDELQNRLRSTIMIRRLKASVLSELPAKRRQIIALEPDADGRKAIAAEQKAAARHDKERQALLVAVELAKASEDPAVYEEASRKLKAASAAAFEEIAKLRLETARAKVEAVIEHVRDAESKIVVFAHHREIVAAIAEAFGSAAVTLTGETPIEERQAAVDRFQSDPDCLVFVGSIRAAGVGLTLTAASHVVFAELDWTPGAMSQAEDRCHRIGQTSSVLVQHLVLDGSIDARLASTLIAKQAVADAALDTGAAAPVAEEAPDVDVDALVASASAKAAEQEAATKTTTRKQIEKEAETLTQEQVKAIHLALQILADHDPDRAGEKNEIGFNALDGAIGHSLARANSLTQRQAALGLRIIRKYHRQLSPELLAKAKGE